MKVISKACESIVLVAAAVINIATGAMLIFIRIKLARNSDKNVPDFSIKAVGKLYRSFSNGLQSLIFKPLDFISRKYTQYRVRKAIEKAIADTEDIKAKFVLSGKPSS